MTERDIFLAAIDLADPAAQAAYLDLVCDGDASLRARVESLLRSHEAAGSFLCVPAVGDLEAIGSITRDIPGHQGSRSDQTGSRAPERDESLGFLAPSHRPDSLGRIGHYEILEVLGRGAFGIVFRAFDEVLHRVVAVKVLVPELATASPARKRFLREARSSAAVRHEHIVQVYAVGEEPLPYLVMEFIPGETLQQRVDRTGPLDVAEVLRIGRQIAEGLAAAHEMGLIHRDIKPANVLLDARPTPRVKISDFGLARAADDATLTRSGVVAGTPTYMSPEQARGDALDPRTDLFSLGSVLYVLCTGRLPFRASGTIAVLKRVCEEDPRPIRDVIPEVPERLCHIIQTLHAKDPDGRFQTAQEVAELLANCESATPAPKRLTRFSGKLFELRKPSWSLPQPRRSVAIAAVCAPVMLLVSWAVWSGPATLRYFRNKGEVVVDPTPGLSSYIIWRDGDAVTDWFDGKAGKTIELPPGTYEFKTGLWPAGRTVERWELTTHGLFSTRSSWQGKHDFVVDVAPGDHVTVRPVLRAPPRPG
jgi:serine/threonine protein kinase